METRKMLASYTEGGNTLQLWEAMVDGEKAYELVSGGVFLMASYNALSSEWMVRRAVERCSHPRTLLIGGLGLGYSVREACRARELERIDVVEIDRQVIDWNRGLLSEALGAMDDPRVSIIEGDFLEYLYQTQTRYDCICMDIDNGPMLLVHPQNEAVYKEPFLRRAMKQLTPGGIFVIWSCGESEELLKRMQMVFPHCETEVVEEEHRGRKVLYYLYFGRCE